MLEFILLQLIFLFCDVSGLEEISITSTGTYTCTSSETECRMTVESSCGSNCDDSTYNCPSTSSCQLCELIITGGDYSARNGELNSNQCDKVNVILDSTGYRAMRG